MRRFGRGPGTLLAYERVDASSVGSRRCGFESLQGCFE
jgi:hypothetical protein